jgi:ABC-2 type transport system ATP-binding protein
MLKDKRMIQIEHLDFGYGGESLFRSLDLTLAPGNIYGLLGVNGAGKSTLLKLATGLLFAESGSLRTLGYDPAQRAPGFLSQLFVLPEELNVPSVTDREYLAVRAPFYPRFDHARFERYTRELELPRGRKLTSLSYGQKKKFLLSFGLACQSALLLMDEPTNGLDIPSKGQFRRLIAEAMSEDRLFVISTHQVRDVASLIDPIVILHDGRVLLSRTLTEVAARIRMQHTATRPADDTRDLLHWEPAVEGFWTVWQDDTAAGGQIDLEVLFNTVVSRPDACRGLFDNREVIS